MKKIILSATMLSGLMLVACVPVDGDQIGLPFNDFKAEAAAVLSSDNIVTNSTPTTNGADEGQNFTANFDPRKAQYFAQKGATIGLNGAGITTKVNSIASGTSRIKNGNVWDRVQDHPITMDMEVDVNLGIADLADPTQAKINKARLTFLGNFGTDSVTEFQTYDSDPNNDLKGKKIADLNNDDFIVGDIDAIFGSDTLEDYARNLLEPFVDIEGNETFGAYRNGDQYTAFFASGSKATNASDIEGSSGTENYAIDYRGLAKWNGAKAVLKGTGNLAVNFSDGDYDGNIAVKAGSSNFGDIKFFGDALAADNKTSFADNAATFKRSGSTDTINGYVSGTAFGNNAGNFLGTTDFADGDDVLVGAFKATK